MLRESEEYEQKQLKTNIEAILMKIIEAGEGGTNTSSSERSSMGCKEVASIANMIPARPSNSNLENEVGNETAKNRELSEEELMQYI